MPPAVSMHAYTDNASMLNPFRHPARLCGWHNLVVLLIAASSLAACSPALNWREIRPKDIDILLTFPCKPQQIAQNVQLAGKIVRMSMTGCATDGMTFALAHADLGDRTLVGSAMTALHTAALQNVAGRVVHSQPAGVAHAAHDLPDALDLEIAGKSPSGKPLRERVVLFAQGSQVFQITTFAQTSRYRADAAQTFSSSVRLPAPG